MLNEYINKMWIINTFKKIFRPRQSTNQSSILMFVWFFNIMSSSTKAQTENTNIYRSVANKCIIF